MLEQTRSRELPAESRPARSAFSGAWRELATGLRPPPEGKIAARLRLLRGPLWFLPVLALVIGVYIYFMSAGGRAHWPVYGEYHDYQAEGFRAGQLNLTLEPHPQLLKVKDPYDRKNSRYWSIDATYYRGKYYAYWGPAPALVWAGVKSVLGIRRVVGDHYIVLGALSLVFLCGGLLVERIARRLFGAVPLGLVALCCVAFGLANPLLHAATTPGTYNAAIISGQAFLLAGLLPAFEAVWRAEPERSQRLRLVLAGTAWGFALASRLTLVGGIAVFIAVTALMEGWSAKRRYRRMLATALWLGLPVAFAGFALLAYNKARFDDWLEFGSKIQLSHFPLRLSPDYIPANLYTYLLRPFVASCQFPYVFQVWSMDNRLAFPEDFQLPRGHLTLEPVIGWLRAVPMTWLMPLAALGAPAALRLSRRETRAYVWCVVAFGALATLTGLVDLFIFSATMRYLGDVSQGLMLLAILGAFALRSQAVGKAFPRVTTALIVVLALGTIGMGVLIGYQGYGGQFAYNNRELDAWFVEKLSVCGGKPAHVPKFSPW